MRIGARIFLAALSLGLGGSAAMAEECLPLNKDIEITGFYTIATYPGPPEFNSVDKGDEARRGYFLVKPAGQCIESKGDDFAPAGKHITDLIQLTCKPDKPEGSFVKLIGRLFSANNANHFTRFLLSCPTS